MCKKKHLSSCLFKTPFLKSPVSFDWSGLTGLNKPHPLHFSINHGCHGGGDCTAETSPCHKIHDSLLVDTFKIFIKHLELLYIKDKNMKISLYLIFDLQQTLTNHFRYFFRSGCTILSFNRSFIVSCFYISTFTFTLASTHYKHKLIFKEKKKQASNMASSNSGYFPSAENGCSIFPLFSPALTISNYTALWWISDTNQALLMHSHGYDYNLI